MALKIYPGFEADLHPVTHNPRIRFNFANGYQGSLVIRRGGNPTLAPIAAVALLKNREVVEIGSNEASAEEAIAFLYAASQRRDCPGHVASDDDPKRCRHCGTHIDELRDEGDEL